MADMAHVDYEELLQRGVAELTKQVELGVEDCLADMPDGNPDDYFHDIAQGVCFDYPPDVVAEFKRQQGLEF